ncbi:molybdopterin-dependent oxidoreductase [Methanobacterium alcaliphilum]|uniref:molybdopterin-dependent oxidoreductase n=1 Tax=Methanobacterium alcaliphilum TaxID=392018 RepID=UPI00200B5211|nr:molybdopterin-dependent oxidoreductase [Methanobacterium alcaliphilum]MCK9152535.1 molybdopterin-dependent oxidoreductase [Methanobacterium alcaliphilum]
MMIKHTICPSCSVGCGINLINRDEVVIGTYPYKKHPVNEGKNCIKGRDSFEKVNNQQRIKTPMIKKNNAFNGVDWEKSLKFISEKLKTYSPNELGIIASGTNTNEEAEIINSFASSYGVTQIGYYSGEFPEFDEQVASMDEINNSDFIFIIGDVLKDNPLIGRRIILAKEKGAEIASVDTLNISTTSMNSDKYLQVDSISEFMDNGFKEIIDNLTESSIIIFNKLDDKNDFEKILRVSKMNKSKILPVLKECNSKGVMDHITPMNTSQIKDLISKVKVLMIIQDDTASYIGESEFKGLDLLIIIATSTNETTNLADIILPGTCWAEKEGSFTNSAGNTQNFSKVVNAPENALEDALILHKIAENVGIDL